LPTPLASWRTLSATQARQMEIVVLQEKVARSTWYFYFVGTFSLLHSALGAVGIDFIPSLGLSVTIGVEGFSQSLTGSKSIPPIAPLFDLVPIGFYVLLGFLARKHWGWFVVAIVFYTIDGLISLGVQDWIGLIVHAYVLWVLWNGMTAARAARNLEKIAAASPS